MTQHQKISIADIMPYIKKYGLRAVRIAMEEWEKRKPGENQTLILLRIVAKITVEVTKPVPTKKALE
ncbi:MAG: hypothetical protein IJB33_03760 [Akkermansia sp.]|nr:hypothetical protein [Akkermansia sp.]